MGFARIWAKLLESEGGKGMWCDWLTKDVEKESLFIGELCLALYKEDLTNEERPFLIGENSMGWAEYIEK